MTHGGVAHRRPPLGIPSRKAAAMPMVVSKRQRIYFRYEGERGAFLMLHHGLFGSHQDWYQAGYVEELAREFRLVIPDARGHGRSDHPTEVADYALSAFAEDLVEIINGLGIRNLHFLGYGMGALVGLEMLRRFPDRVRIAVLGGESPLTLPGTRAQWQALAAQLRGGTLGGLLASLRQANRLVRYGPGDPPEEDLTSALALLDALGEWELHNDERISVTSPVTLFGGSDDPAAERVERARSFVNRARLAIFPGFTHAGLFSERTPVTQELVRLLKSGRRDDADGHRRQTEGAESAGDHPARGPERRTGRGDNRPSDRRDERRNRDRRFDHSRDAGTRPYPREGQTAIAPQTVPAPASPLAAAEPQGPPPGPGTDAGGTASLSVAPEPRAGDISTGAAPGNPSADNSNTILPALPENDSPAHAAVDPAPKRDGE